MVLVTLQHSGLRIGLNQIKTKLKKKANKQKRHIEHFEESMAISQPPPPPPLPLQSKEMFKKLFFFQHFHFAALEGLKQPLLLGSAK